MEEETIKSWTKQLSTSSIESNLESSGTDFKMFHINSCFPSTLLELEIHVSILRAGNSPHKPHTHPQEELIIILSGKLQIIRTAPSQKIIKSTPLGPGSLTYHDSNRAHTVYSVGPEPAIYICIKWSGKKIKERNNLLTSSDFIPDYIEEKKTLHSEFKTSKLFESPTEFLEKLHCHISHMKPDSGYEPHKDSYDVMIILLDGKIETLNKELESKSVIFYQAGEPHGMKNIGSKVAQYIVFEFHGKDYIFNAQMYIRRIFKSILRRVMPRKHSEEYAFKIVENKNL